MNEINFDLFVSFSSDTDTTVNEMSIHSLIYCLYAYKTKVVHMTSVQPSAKCGINRHLTVVFSSAEPLIYVNETIIFSMSSAI